MGKRFVDIILIVVLIFQLLPANKAGRSLLFDLSDDGLSDAPACKIQQCQTEEEYKDVHLYYSGLHVPCKNVVVSLFHFSENLPVAHARAISTPPPDQLT